MAVERKRLSAVRYAPQPHESGATVTVVIPCYNYARFLPEAVHSALSQDGVVVDVIVVDDASTDGSLAVAHCLAIEDSRVRVIGSGHNGGAVETFNRGLGEARGEFLVRLDADDLLTPGSLKRAVALMQHLPNVGLVYGHPIHFSGTRLPAARRRASSWTIWSGHDWLAARCIDGTNAITSPEVVMRRSIVDVVGGQRPLAHTHDMEMWLRISAFADIGYIDGADQAWHREHPGSLSTAAEEPIVILREVCMAFDELFRAVGERVEDSAGLLQRAHRAVASEALDQVSRQLDRGRGIAEVAELLEFATAVLPDIRSISTWHRVQRELARRSPIGAVFARVRGIVPRLRRHVRSRVRYARWSRSGEYERMHIAHVARSGAGTEAATGGLVGMPSQEPASR